MRSLRVRAREPELMDLPDSDPVLYAQTVAQFAFVNRWLTRARHLLKRHIVHDMQANPSRHYHMVELGAGGCETAAWLLEHCRRCGLKLRMSAIDHDPRAIEFARARYGDVDGLSIIQGDIVKMKDVGSFEFFYANHLLHHLENDQIVELFAILREHPEAGIIINDIHRTRSAYIGYHVFSAILLRHSFARYDGLLSIRKGFRKEELEELARAADPDSADRYRVKCIPPARVVIYSRR